MTEPLWALAAGCVPDVMSNLKKYVENITNRPAFKIAIEMQ